MGIAIRRGCFNSARPMSLISAIYGTDDDDEICEMLYMIVNVSISQQLTQSKRKSI